VSPGIQGGETFRVFLEFFGFLLEGLRELEGFTLGSGIKAVLVLGGKVFFGVQSCVWRSRTRGGVSTQVPELISLGDLKRTPRTFSRFNRFSELEDLRVYFCF